MKNFFKLGFFKACGVIALAAIIGIGLAGCDPNGGGGGGGGDPDLAGTITITPSGTVATGRELTATYDGTETVDFQWKKDETNVPTGGTGTTYTPSAAGSYTVTVSATGYKSKTSAAVTVTVAQPLSGSITINPSGTVATGRELTATYSGGTETVDFQWKKDGNDITSGGTGTTYTPTVVGSYAVTVSAAGYESKTSTAVTVTDPLQNWTVINAPFTGHIYTIAYGGGKFVAGGDSGKMATSDDGENWTEVESTFTSSYSIYSIAYGGGKFVAGGSYGRMATSDDGVIWTEVENSQLSSINGIAYGGPSGSEQFVAVGSGGRIATSPDGVTWTAVIHPANPFITDGYPNIGIAYGDGKFVAVGQKGMRAHSSDGATWTRVNTNSTGSTSTRSIAFGGGKFVEAKYNSDNIMSSSTNGGVTWPSVTTPTFSSYLIEINDIAYGDGKFVVGGDSGELAYSSDCATWTALTISGFDSDINGIAYGDNKFVAVGLSGKIAYSD
ncbi:hypothetical protein AGMMS49960_12460 [Betaproteobacteria bacterium]|nr:hypothetical protein AGMMS49960_12460 [Betaproteobacteria bacterium]